MATHNGARQIAGQLASLAAQTLLPAELVVTDDCSTDETIARVTAFAAAAPFPVRIESNATQLGYKANFMHAADLCGSDLIAFCDQDDIWLPGKLKTCVDAFDRDDVLLAYHNATVVTDDLQPIGSLHGGASSHVVRKFQSDPWHYGLGFTLVFRRALLSFSESRLSSADFYHFDEPEAHDQWIFFLASCLGDVAYIGEPQVLYRQHQTNTFGWRDNSPSLLGLWYNVMLSGVDGLALRAIAAGKRAAILDRITPELSDEQRRRARSSAAGYRKLESSYRLRREMYETTKLRSRMRQLLSLLRNGAYGARVHWGVGKKALARDAVCNVFFGDRGAHPATAQPTTAEAIHTGAPRGKRSPETTASRGNVTGRPPRELPL